MSRMSDLDLMVREGDRTAEDFIARGIDARTARAMEGVVEASNVDETDHPQRENFTEAEIYEALDNVGLIDGEGFYTVHETKR